MLHTHTHTSIRLDVFTQYAYMQLKKHTKLDVVWQ